METAKGISEWYVKKWACHLCELKWVCRFVLAFMRFQQLHIFIVSLDWMYPVLLLQLIDFGCGEGQILSLLTYPYDEYPITRLAGVDIDEEALNMARERCQPDELYINISPLTLDLYQGMCERSLT